MVQGTDSMAKVMIGVNAISHKGFVLMKDRDAAGVEIGSNEDGAYITVLGKGAKRRVSMGVDEWRDRNRGWEG